ncbi:endonuclease MutS2, partial [Streptococcus pyogenes]
EADLNILELLAAKRILTISKELADFYANLENVSLRQLDKLFEKIETFPSLQGTLMAVNEGGFLEDFASEALLKIRRKIQEAEVQVRQVMQDLLKAKADML